jgi:mono/diheme cytochrome c family protein
MCHGPTGQGTQMGVALTAGLDYDAVKEKIVKGMVSPGEKMPPMAAALSADQLDDLAKFVAAGLPQ